MEWIQTYPGLPSMVPAVRAFVRGLLVTSPRADDAELVVSELAGNAIRHTPSGRGGTFSVQVSMRPGWVRLAVSDSGTGRWTRPDASPDEVAEYGRGLGIVDACADKVGQDITVAGQTMWAEFAWPTEEEQRA